MNISATRYTYIIIIESLLITFAIVVFVKMIIRLQAKPKNRNEVDEEIENELKGNS